MLSNVFAVSVTIAGIHDGGVVPEAASECHENHQGRIHQNHRRIYFCRQATGCAFHRN